MLHLKVRNSLGHRTRDAQVIQLPVAKSWLPEALAPLWWEPWLVGGASVFLWTSGGSATPSPATSCLFFLPLLNSEGNGLLMERECGGLFDRWVLGAAESESDELDSASLVVGGKPILPGSVVGVLSAMLWMRVIGSAARDVDCEP